MGGWFLVFIKNENLNDVLEYFDNMAGKRPRAFFYHNEQ